jgi:hypothetical protein
MLERLDHLRERWLRHVQSLGRAPEMQLLGDSDEVPRFPHFDH